MASKTLTFCPLVLLEDWECPPAKGYKLANLRRYNSHAGGVAQVVEYLPSKWEALSSNPTTKGKKNPN
jgi:hypothetical protein